MNDNIVCFADEENIVLKDTNISASDVVTAANMGTDEQIALFDGNSKKIKNGPTINEIKANIPLTILSSSGGSYVDPYIVEDKDIMIIVRRPTQIILPLVSCSSERQIIFKNQSELPVIINALSPDNIDGAINVTLENDNYIHLVASNCEHRWNIIACSQVGNDGTVTSVGLTNIDGNLSIQDSPVTTAGNIEVNLSDYINVKGITSKGIGKIKYLESQSVIVDGQVIADYFSTRGGVLAKGTIQGGTLVSQGDITSHSDTNTVRLNFHNDEKRLTLAQNIAQKKNFSLILPIDAGKADQVLSTDGYGNLSWIDSSNTGIIRGKSILNGIEGVVINNSRVNVDSIISVTRNMGNSHEILVETIGNLVVGSIIANVSFTVYSTVENDIGNFDWLIINS